MPDIKTILQTTKPILKFDFRYISFFNRLPLPQIDRRNTKIYYIRAKNLNILNLKYLILNFNSNSYFSLFQSALFARFSFSKSISKYLGFLDIYVSIY